MNQTSVQWRSPSNIALVKYWGKRAIQLPTNPSVSFTLSNAYTETRVDLQKRGDQRIRFLFHGKEEPSFLPKLEQFIARAEKRLPWLEEYSLDISSSNSFPHSSGIASSASGMSALAMCLASIDAKRQEGLLDLMLASQLARLGSGSACRSVFGGFTLWGQSSGLFDSADEYAVPVPDVHPDFMDLQDTILFVDKGKKAVSSTAGHGLMEGHPYAASRFKQADANTLRILDILSTGDFMALAELMEQEALALHAMMMTSSPHFLLFRPGTIAIIQRIMELRNEGAPLSFTLDAGANVHMIYPGRFQEEAMDIVQRELLESCQDRGYLCDHVGQGPEEMALAPC